MKKALFLLSFLMLFLLGCSSNYVPIKATAWEFESASTAYHSQRGYLYAENEKHKSDSSDERCIYISCSLEAEDETFVIKDITNGITYSGSYRLKNKEIETSVYTVKINGTEGYAVTGKTAYADQSERKTLILVVGEYTLYFYETK